MHCSQTTTGSLHIDCHSDKHPHLLHGNKFTSEPKDLNQPGARGDRELEGREGHHTVEGHELKGNGVHGHEPDHDQPEGPGPGEGMSAASRPPVTQRVKGRVEVMVGKVTRDMEMMDRGLHRQRQVDPPRSEGAQSSDSTAVQA